MYIFSKISNFFKYKYNYGKVGEILSRVFHLISLDSQITSKCIKILAELKSAVTNPSTDDNVMKHQNWGSSDDTPPNQKLVANSLSQFYLVNENHKISPLCTGANIGTQGNYHLGKTLPHVQFHQQCSALPIWHLIPQLQDPSVAGTDEEEKKGRLW